uniref:MFS transporter n=1 Tax=Heterorhabditis bacteriophora TaxID=37862 RepID=A0A1I7WF14_HETBA
MALNLVASFIFLPLDVVGTMALDRLGRRPVFFLTAALMYCH